VFAKPFEIVLEAQLALHFYNVFSKDMFGFMKKVSCEHALLELTEWCRRAIDDKQRPAILAIDLSRASDSVNHALLLKKLKCYGLDSSSCELLRCVR
jgi:retron-type reverse transcriptase